MSRLEELLKRKDRVREIERRDPDRFKPNPLGPGYFTRYQRYTELYREINEKIDAWITQDDASTVKVWFDESDEIERIFKDTAP